MQGGGMRRSGATTIDDNAEDEKSDKSIWRLLNIRCTSFAATADELWREQYESICNRCCRTAGTRCDE